MAFVYCCKSCGTSWRKSAGPSAFFPFAALITATADTECPSCGGESTLEAAGNKADRLWSEGSSDSRDDEKAQ